jgi:serine/threonine protein kinase
MQHRSRNSQGRGKGEVLRRLGGSGWATAHPSSTPGAPRQRLPSELQARNFGLYHPERVISTGPYGAVFTARHPNHLGLVVIKALLPHLREDPLATLRLSREAHVLARIDSDHVVRLLDTGWTEWTGPFLVLEYLEGVDLARVLEAQGPLPLPLAVDYALQLCEALGVAHAGGIIHCDIKPKNLLAMAGSQQPLLKLLDFGICRCGPETFPYRDIGAPEGATEHAERELIGTSAYMSPERIRDLKTIDQRSDIWSVGVVLHELLTGHRVFSGTDTADICRRIVKHQFHLESDGSVLPVPLRAVIARCLARRPAHRFQDVHALAAALRRVTSLPAGWRGMRTGTFPRQAGDLSLLAHYTDAASASGQADPFAAQKLAPVPSASIARGAKSRWWLIALAVLGAGLALSAGLRNCQIENSRWVTTVMTRALAD